MNLLTAENISKSYSEKPLFENITLGINEGDKIGIIGVNGTGKSTLLKIICGITVPDTGNIIKANMTTLGYLPQYSDFEGNLTVLEQIFIGPSKLMTILREYENTIRLLESNSHDKSNQKKLISLSMKIDELNAWETESQAKTILSKLGISDYNAITNTLSGGQKKRIALAKALINPSNLLILDEPTNHLDEDTIEWLEDYLNKRGCALLMITHDRFFLDKITNRMLELDNGKLYSYTGNYSNFLEKKAERLEKEDANERKKQNLIRKELLWINRGAKARSTKQKARIQRFEDLTQENSNINNSKLEINTQSTRLGRKVIELTGINKCFEAKVLIQNFSCNIKRDDRIGIIGPNGCGKSTLMNIIGGKLEPDSGSIDKGVTVNIGFYTQEISDMDSNLRVIEYIRETAEYISTSEGGKISASQMLEKFLFKPSVQWEYISHLSGGERRRLYLLKILMSSPNILLLDEPTNDLDIETLTILEDYLESFNGAVIAVSHDRYFLDKIIDRLYVFEGSGKITQFTGNYSYLHELQNKELLSKVSVKKEHESNNYKSSNEKPVKFTFNEQREFNEIDNIIEELEKALENKKNEIDKASSDYILLQKLFSEKEALEKELEQKMDRWAYLNELNEIIINSKH